MKHLSENMSTVTRRDSQYRDGMHDIKTTFALTGLTGNLIPLLLFFLIFWHFTCYIVLYLLNLIYMFQLSFTKNAFAMKRVLDSKLVWRWWKRILKAYLFVAVQFDFVV